jgi:hypothetical protein
MGFLNYNIIFDIDLSNYETDYTKIRHDFWSRGVVPEFSKMAVSLKWILDYFVGNTLGFWNRTRARVTTFTNHLLISYQTLSRVFWKF